MNPGATTWPVASIDARAVERRLRDRGDFAGPDADVAHRVEARRGIHDPAVRDDEIMGGLNGLAARAGRDEQRGGGNDDGEAGTQGGSSVRVCAR